MRIIPGRSQGLYESCLGLGHVSTFQASQAVHGSGMYCMNRHMLLDLKLLSYDPYDLPDAKSE